MNLRNNQITVCELLSNPQARALFERKFPAFAGSPMLANFSGSSLEQVLCLAKNFVSAAELQRFVTELSKI